MVIEKYCYDCRHYRDKTVLKNGDLFFTFMKVCINTKVMSKYDIADGNPMTHNFCSASEVRSKVEGCGFDAKFHDPID